MGFKDGKLVPDGIGPKTVAALDSIRNVLEKNGSSMEQVIKCILFLTDMADYPVMNAEYIKVFASKRPARAAVGVRNLWAGSHIEIECMARVDTE